MDDHNQTSDHEYSIYSYPNLYTKVDPSYMKYISYWMLDKCKEYKEYNTINGN